MNRRSMQLIVLIWVSVQFHSMASEPPTAATVILKVPKYGSKKATLKGKVSGVNGADFKVAVFLGLDQVFYNKPNFDNLNTAISKSGSFSCDVSSGANDKLAQKFVVFIVPKAFEIPALNGAATFPQTLLDAAVGFKDADRAPRTVSFAKWKWNVKSGIGFLGPGPNIFSVDPKNVSVVKGALHLAINEGAHGWQCAEIVSQQPADYGKYEFTIAGSNVQALDQNAVFGLFPYDDSAYTDPLNHSEIDFEFSRWSNAADVNNAQFVVQPFNVTGHLQRFLADRSGPIVLLMDWQPGTVAFTAKAGDDTIGKFTYAGSDVPAPGQAHLHLNLWLFNGAAPSNGKPQEVVVRDFKYTK